MVRTFFTALTIPEQVLSTTTRAVAPFVRRYHPAVHPRDREPRKTVYGPRLALRIPSRPELLSHKIEKWALGEVETETDDREVTAWRMFLPQLVTTLDYFM
jgi:hypothetical protein